MIELLFLAFILPKRMRILARERDRSALGWTFAAIGAWLGVEFIIIFAWAFVYGLGLAFWGWTEDMEKGSFAFCAYATALIGGMVSADLVRRRLTKLPVTREVKPWKGIWG